MKKKLIFAFLLLILGVVLGIEISKKYQKYKKQNKSKNESYSILTYQKYLIESNQYNELVSLLHPYRVFLKDNNRQAAVKFRLGDLGDGGYVVINKMFESADALMSYGIADNTSFEDNFIIRTNKPVYAFDCSVSPDQVLNKKINFYSECISSDMYIGNYFKDKSSNVKHRISSYNDQIKRLNLDSKHIFLKMDIEGAEYESLSFISEHHMKNMTGIVLELHGLENEKDRKRALQLLAKLNTYFYLIHIHGNNCNLNFIYNEDHILSKLPSVIELTYINKSFVSRAELDHSIYPIPNLDYPNCGRILHDYSFQF